MNATDYIDRSLDDLRIAYGIINEDARKWKFIPNDEYRQSMELIDDITKTLPDLFDLLQYSNSNFESERKE